MHNPVSNLDEQPGSNDAGNGILHHLKQKAVPYAVVSLLVVGAALGLVIGLGSSRKSEGDMDPTFGSPDKISFDFLNSRLTTANPTITFSPSMVPSHVPSNQPSGSPSTVPSLSTYPSTAPSGVPSNSPSGLPSEVPSLSTYPSTTPSGVPTHSPSGSPSSMPSPSPSSSPSSAPSTSAPTTTPSYSPSEAPTLMHSNSPSSEPSPSPTAIPSVAPSEMPSVVPSPTPTGAPTVTHSAVPTAVHSEAPTTAPSETPSTTPSGLPTPTPSASPSVSASSSPTAQHSSAPTTTPTMAPSETPSEVPSPRPSPLPTSTPSSSPTTLPSIGPSAVPTDFYVDPYPEPENPPPGYFNYDVNSAYGPNHWDQVDTSNHTLREFTTEYGFGPFQGHLDDRDVLRNRCGGPDKKQSPKDLIDTIGCEAHHEIRSFCGTAGIASERYERLILPHKLSLVMNRRPCLDVEDPDCAIGRPPIADYPRYSSLVTPYSDLLNLDIKVPGEHTLEGESFDAEIQLLHTHLDPARVSSIGIPVRATADGHNSEFQEILDQFQQTYMENEMECMVRRKRRGRHLRTGNNHGVEDFYTNSTQKTEQRGLQQARRFNPYSPAFMPNVFFYRYDGSITEPPCLDITWWVMIDPMVISHDQLLEIKKILFLNVDPSNECLPTSVHNAEQSVVRPIQPLGERDIQKCSEGIFVSDEEKGRGDGNICR